MSESRFVSVDTFKIAEFQKESMDINNEFNSIKEKFNSINTALLDKWEGEGAEAYRYETEHILENIGGIKDILDSINEGVLVDIRNVYCTLDNDLSEYNRNPQSAENESSGG